MVDGRGPRVNNGSGCTPGARKLQDAGVRCKVAAGDAHLPQCCSDQVAAQHIRESSQMGEGRFQREDLGLGKADQASHKFLHLQIASHLVSKPSECVQLRREIEQHKEELAKATDTVSLPVHTSRRVNDIHELCLAQEERVRMYNLQHMKQERLAKLGEGLQEVVTHHLWKCLWQG